MSPDDSRGVLVAIVGPSGVGKDALMSAAARHLAPDPRVRFARRVVTRVASAGSEDHDSLDEAGFVRAEAAGAFALTWTAHGLHYGLPRSVAFDITTGLTVVANLSRRTLGDACLRFGRLRIVEVTADRDTLLRRLVARGRESEETIRARFVREAPVVVPDGAEDHLVLDNSGDLDIATHILVRYIEAARTHH